MKFICIVFIALSWCCSPSQNDRPGQIKTPNSTKETFSEENDVAQEPSIEERLMASLSPAAKTKLEKDISKFAVCELYFKKPSEVTVKNQSDFYVASYQKEGKIYATKIKITGNSIAWGNSDGRWRNHPSDESLSYSIGDGEISILVRYSDGSESTNTYKSELARLK